MNGGPQRHYLCQVRGATSRKVPQVPISANVTMMGKQNLLCRIVTLSDEMIIASGDTKVESIQALARSADFVTWLSHTYTW